MTAARCGRDQFGEGSEGFADAEVKCTAVKRVPISVISK